jgi:hypothetical protein
MELEVQLCAEKREKCILGQAAALCPWSAQEVATSCLQKEGRGDGFVETRLIEKIPHCSGQRGEGTGDEPDLPKAGGAA